MTTSGQDLNLSFHNCGDLDPHDSYMSFTNEEGKFITMDRRTMCKSFVTEAQLGSGFTISSSPPSWRTNSKKTFSVGVVIGIATTLALIKWK